MKLTTYIAHIGGGAFITGQMAMFMASICRLLESAAQWHYLEVLDQITCDQLKQTISRMLLESISAGGPDQLIQDPDRFPINIQVALPKLSEAPHTMPRIHVSLYLRAYGMDETKHCHFVAGPPQFVQAVRTNWDTLALNPIDIIDQE